MNRLSRWIGCGLVAGLACLPGRVAWGQEPPAVPLPHPAPVVIDHEGPILEAEPEDLPAHPAAAPQRRHWYRPFENHPVCNGIQNYMHAHGVACYADFNNPSCSSLCSELTFIFGSCRTFFGEPCLRRPDPDAEFGYGGYGQPGCGCWGR
jgi:hypothetical protein